ncbi:MAG: hypothetical protein EOO77_31405 [Oxalobacteraceae bacterium]|nr:MAG: hypothetical protein EOO77_31405 [Oxalobacteraceae bacterium]
MNYRNAVIAAATMLTATTASAAPVTFFGEDRVTSGTQVTSRSNADAARTAFFDNLTGVGTETFEGFAQNTRTPLNIDFTGAGTATLLGGGTVQTTSYGLSVGRYAISGTKYLDASSTFSLTFSDAISAFGFYGTDIGDIGSALSLTLTGTNGVTVLNVPNGNSMTPKELYRRYFGYTEEVKTKKNSLLLRNYLTNFDRPILLTYVEGEYMIKEVRKLGEGDLFEPGVAVRLQAMVNPDDFTKPMPYPVFIDCLYPTADAGAITSFKPGEMLTLKKSPNCMVVIHVAKTVSEEDQALLLTAVPIASGLHHIGESEPFTIEPPVTLRPGKGLPVFKD